MVIFTRQRWVCTLYRFRKLWTSNTQLRSICHRRIPYGVSNCQKRSIGTCVRGRAIGKRNWNQIRWYNSPNSNSSLRQLTQFSSTRTQSIQTRTEWFGQTGLARSLCSSPASLHSLRKNRFIVEPIAKPVWMGFCRQFMSEQSQAGICWLHALYMGASCREWQCK
jgi:hypothetical protein